MSKYYYEKSGIIDSKFNITYHELFLKTDEELDEWIEEARQFIIKDWDENGTPPMVGQNIDQIISSFKKLTNGKDLTIVSSAYGSLEALKVSEFLKTKNIDIENYNLQMFKPLDISKIYKSVKKTGKLITIDTGHIIYGASSEIITSLVSQNEKIFDKKPIRLGLPDIPTPSSRGYVKNYYPNSIMILSNILDLFNYNKKTKNTLINEFKKKYNVKSIYDVPNKEFKGPF